jgi:hypothetical protein
MRAKVRTVLFRFKIESRPEALQLYIACDLFSYLACECSVIPAVIVGHLAMVRHKLCGTFL